MNERIIVKVTDLIGSELCISAEDGQKVFEKILLLLKEGKLITISFEHVTMLISLFLNVAIGQLYGSLAESEIKSLVRVDGLADDDIELLKRVVDNAKKYYSNTKAYDEAWQGVSDEE